MISVETNGYILTARSLENPYSLPDRTDQGKIEFAFLWIVSGFGIWV